MPKPARRAFFVAAAGAVALLAGGGAGAEAPERSAASYGNWELRCETRSTEEATTEACEIVQAIQLQGQPQPLTRIAIGRPAPESALVMVLQVPIGIWLPAGVGIELDEDEAIHRATMKRCVPAGCFADLELTDAIVERLSQGGDEQGRIVFATAEGQDARVPILFRGFPSAFEALMARIASE